MMLSVSPTQYNILIMIFKHTYVAFHKLECVCVYICMQFQKSFGNKAYLAAPCSSHSLTDFQFALLFSGSIKKKRCIKT